MSSPITTRSERNEDVIGSSDRSFGLVFAVVFVAISIWCYVVDSPLTIYFTAISIGFTAIAIARPVILSPLNRRWLKLGLLLNRVVSPVVLGLIFFVVITPIGLVLRCFGKLDFQSKLMPDAQTYWISREPPGPPPESLTNQF